MHQKLIICMASFYFTIKTLASLIVMPLLKSKKDIDNLTHLSKVHYDSVKKDRMIKGCISILVGLILGITMLVILKPHYSKNKLVCICIILFVTFFSMQLVYELLWQNKFIFEYNNINSLKMKEDTDNIFSDIQIYARMYKDSRLSQNIIEVSSISISLILTLIIYYNIKK